MKGYQKYHKQYFLPPHTDNSWQEQDFIAEAPLWCSVDLRDGNQALITPMSLEQKLLYFQMLVDLGFKEIEIGFPASCDTEFNFVRTLIERNLIPDDVTIQVMTQLREHIMRRTFEALSGAKKAIVHLYNPISYAQRTQVFHKNQDETISLATAGAQLFRQLCEEYHANYRALYTPESFTGAEPEFALALCNAVLGILEPTADNKPIINLPATIEHSMPHIYARQVAFMHQNLQYRSDIILSLHPHNDRGCAVADAEMGVLAGAERIEGTLFGNGERTGNVDLITLALNLYSQGIDPQLDFSRIPEVINTYESLTGMSVGERTPYSGKLVFASFAGAHQDAITKGLKWRENNPEKYWSVPYLPIDPTDIGREYETDVIRINSQSGKGGIAYLLEHDYQVSLPKTMQAAVGIAVKAASDQKHAELSSKEVYQAFVRQFVNISAPIELIDFDFTLEKTITVTIYLKYQGVIKRFSASANGHLDAVSNALHGGLHIPFGNLTYHEHAMGSGTDTLAISYVSITAPDGSVNWGAGIQEDIITSSVYALISAVNRQLAK